jgi:protein-tyrosine kinase
MSKIHDAITKVQKGSIADRRTALFEAHKVPRHLRSGHNDVDLVEAVEQDAKCVIVDLDRLRQAGMLAPERQQRQIARSYSTITELLFNMARRGWSTVGAPMNSIVIASALPGDGRTLNCINQAMTIVDERDVPVILVDADIENPHITQLFGLGSRPGLANALESWDVGAADVLWNTDINGLKILPAGFVAEPSPGLLAGQRMVAIVAELSQEFPDHVVIYDSAPLLSTREARALADCVGQVVMIVSAKQTQRSACFAALELLDKTGSISLVLNQSS